MVVICSVQLKACSCVETEIAESSRVSGHVSEKKYVSVLCRLQFLYLKKERLSIYGKTLKFFPRFFCL